MIVTRTLFALAMAGAACAATPAAAQFFMQSRDLSDAPVRGDEPGIGIAMPGATEDEVRAALVWNLRAALNVAALQCQFEPTLLTLSNYNGVLKNHKAELDKSYATLGKYFLRTAKNAKAGNVAFDQFGTQVYSSYSTSSSQFGFCQATGSIGRDALFAPRASFYKVAVARSRELRNSLVPWGEQRFVRGSGYDRRITTPSFEARCWTRKGEWAANKCGAFQMSAR